MQKHDNTKNIRVVLLGGGTGGHMYPLIALVNQIKRQSQTHGINCKFYYLGDAHGALRKSLEDTGVRVFYIVSSKWRRYWSLKNIIDMFLFGIGFFEAIGCLTTVRPHVIFSKGGPGTLPIIFASRLFKTPLIIHESDTVPGTSNTIAARFADIVELAFPDAQKYFKNVKTKISGLPIREIFFNNRNDKNIAKQKLGFQTDMPLLFVIGGSRGSTPINRFIFENLTELLKQFQILHQVGTSNYKKVKMPNERGYKHVPYLEDEIATALQASDIVLARSGATTLFEIATIGKPAILVPLPLSAGDHQMKNATAYAKSEPAVVINENDLSIDVFQKAVENIRTGAHPGVSIFNTPHAAEIIANDIITLATQRR